MLRRWLLWLAAGLALVVLAGWAWDSPYMERFRVGYRLSRQPPATALPMPVEGVAARQVAATFGAPRGRDRSHQGVDIFARRGTTVRSSTLGLVAAIRDGGLGGRQVWVLGPGRERYYYAHLDAWQDGLVVGQVVLAGAPLGRVGTTGNAKGTPPHLHFGVYGEAGARDPLPLLQAAAATPR